MSSGGSRQSSLRSNSDALSLVASSDEELRSSTPVDPQSAKSSETSKRDLDTSVSHDYDTSAALKEIFRLLDAATCPPQPEQDRKSTKPLSRVDRVRIVPHKVQSLPTGSLIIDNMEAEFAKAKKHNFFLNPSTMVSRFSTTAAVPYDAKSGGLSVECAKLEPASKALGLAESPVTFSTKQMADLSALTRRLLGCLNYQDLAITAMMQLLQQMFAKQGSIDEFKKSSTALFTAIARSSNDAVAHATVSLINLESARRRTAFKHSTQLLPYRQDALMEEPVLSSNLFNNKTEDIKSEVYSEMQNKAFVDISKKSSGPGNRQQGPKRDARSEKKRKPNRKGWNRAKSVNRAKVSLSQGAKRKFPVQEGATSGAKKPRFSSYKPRRQPR